MIKIIQTRKGNAIFGVSIATIVGFVFWMVIIDPILTPELERLFESLSDSAVCPPEFQDQSYKICFDKEGNLIVDGKISETTTVILESNTINEECSIDLGNYNFEFSNCKFDNLKKIEAFNLFLINSRGGKISLSSKALENYISSELYITKFQPKKISFFSKLLKFWKYIPK